MTILEAAGAQLVTDGVGTLASNIFLGILPESPDLCIGVFEYAGLPPYETFNDGGLSLDRPNVQVLVRGPRNDYVAARDKAVAARNSLAKLANVSVSGVTVLRLSPSTSVNAIGYDDNDRPMFSVSFMGVVDV